MLDAVRGVDVTSSSGDTSPPFASGVLASFQYVKVLWVFSVTSL
jgi:hypothetical protein